MSATKKASLMEVKKYLGRPTDTAAQFNEEWKLLSPEAKQELQDLLGTAIENGTVSLA